VFGSRAAVRGVATGACLQTSCTRGRWMWWTVEGVIVCVCVRELFVV
jgi:hypothetical protein